MSAGGGLIANGFETQPGDSNGTEDIPAYSFFEADITSDVVPGGIYQLAFSEANNLGQLEFGIDDVQINIATTRAGGSPTPEPGTILLLGTGLLALAGWKRRFASRMLAPALLIVALGSVHADAAALLAPAPASPFAVGLKPSGVATGDFNGDGYADIAVLNSGNSNVTIMLGNGTAGFTIATGSPFNAGLKPMALVVKDFNKDGKLDLAIVNQQSNNVTVLLGNGTGSFAPAVGSPFTVGAVPNFLATADFNGDTIPDLAVTNSADNTVTILLGNGSGGFAPGAGSPFATGMTPEGVVTGDFNTDGKTDIAVADAGDGLVTVLFGDGKGGVSLTVKVQGCNPGSAIVASLYGMVAGTFNHAYTDLVTVSSGANEINILRGFGNGARTTIISSFPITGSRIW